MRGTIKRWNDAQGTGHAIPDDGGLDAFIHWKNCEGASERRITFRVGDTVIFDVEETAKGRAAKNVKVAP